jgi:hypothetical protein
MRIRKELLGNQNKFDSLVASMQTRIHIPDPNPPAIKLSPMPDMRSSSDFRTPELPSQKY